MEQRAAPGRAPAPERGRRDPPRDGQPGWRVTPAPGGRGAPPPPTPPRPRFGWRLGVFVVGLLILNYALARTLVPNQAQRIRIPYSPTFLAEVRSGNVESITSRGSTIQGRLNEALKYPPDKKSAPTSTRFDTEIPAFADTNALSRLLQRKKVVVNAESLQSGSVWWQQLLFGFGPTLLFLLLLFWLFRRAAGGGAGGLMSFGRSRARRYEPSSDHVTFEDVAGIEEAEAELEEIVDFLKNPDRYRKLGGRIPRGVLLSGQPGTGKTLLAKAVAGEAGVPFFSMSASEFVEMIVGVGASRVRDLFAQAKAAAPAIIFIDELDAIGRARGGGMSNFGGSDEREQTLNQILTEMDGFDTSTSVIVLGATNRPDVLDHALLRPGRFDRRVAVQPPDKAGREAILRVHTRGMPLGPDVDLGTLASTTPGMVGADLANLVNEAALLAARRDHELVRMEDFTSAMEKILLGAERKILLGPRDRERTAYHEAGHAIVGMLTPGADPVRKVSIIPRGMALGVTFAAPNADRFNYDREFLLAKIKVALGGRVAEEVVYGDITTGAESDIQQLTQIARQMVGRWGMSEAIGPVAVLPAEGQGPLLPGVSEVSEQTQRLVDEEVRRLVDTAEGEVADLVRDHRDQLESLAQALLRDETLDEPEAYAAAGIARPPVEEEELPRERV